ncbi:MAG: glycosyltransferase family 2 protein [Williamsia sp.]|nr:glycosyltransferase family 2 protein [Williamsia sp.]
MQLSVIIISYNAKYFLEQCLYAAVKACATIEAEIYVVDNASADTGIEYLQPQFPSIHFIANTRNVGFAKANNQALQMASGEYILFLNPDTILAEDTLTTCIRFMETDREAGACGVHMIDGSGRFLPESKRGFPSPLTSFYKLAGFTALFPRSPRFARYYLGHLSEQQDGEVDVLAGAFFFTRRKILQRIGGFDEAFFMYGEDIDLSYRIQQAGYKNYYLAQTSIIHFKGESTPKRSPQAIRHFYGAMDIFVKKHYKGIEANLFSLFIQLLIRLKLVSTKTDKKNRVSRAKGIPVPTLLVGEPRGWEEVQAILIRNKVPERSIRTVSVNADLQDTLSEQSPEEIVFCEGGDLSFKKIIQWMQTPPAALFKVHAAGSSSIVGSNQKEAQGDALS